MEETMLEARHRADERAFADANTQGLPQVSVLPTASAAPVGARFYRAQADPGTAPVTGPTAEVADDVPASSATPVGARFYRERKPRHRA
jgi:hypothetical protein